jgi:hypothetical protein
MCEFLGVPVPDEPFPRLNDTAQMQRGMRAVKTLTVAVRVALALSVAAALVLLLRRAPIRYESPASP